MLLRGFVIESVSAGDDGQAREEMEFTGRSADRLRELGQPG
jgi:hypothetical protein